MAECAFCSSLIIEISSLEQNAKFPLRVNLKDGAQRSVLADTDCRVCIKLNLRKSFICKPCKFRLAPKLDSRCTKTAESSDLRTRTASWLAMRAVRRMQNNGFPQAALFADCALTVDKAIAKRTPKNPQIVQILLMELCLQVVRL